MFSKIQDKMMIHKHNSIFFLNLCVVELNYQIKDKMAVEKGVGGPSGPMLAPPPPGVGGGGWGEDRGERGNRRAFPGKSYPPPGRSG